MIWIWLCTHQTYIFTYPTYFVGIQCSTYSYHTENMCIYDIICIRVRVHHMYIHVLCISQRHWISSQGKKYLSPSPFPSLPPSLFLSLTHCNCSHPPSLPPSHLWHFLTKNNRGIAPTFKKKLANIGTVSKVDGLSRQSVDHSRNSAGGAKECKTKCKQRYCWRTRNSKKG